MAEYRLSYTGEQVDALLGQINSATPITYSALKALRDGGRLAPGKFYRITDYVTTTSDSESRSVGHLFDVIVLALDERHLSEESYAAHHEGDSYFANSKLDAWRLMYCLDNDLNRFSWADTTNGRGVIYRMIDEFGNDIPFDFKNIQFKRYKISDINIPEMGNSIGRTARIGIYVGLNHTINKFVVDTSDYKWYYTFTRLGETWSSEISDSSIPITSSSAVNRHHSFGNTILLNIANGVRMLNNVVFAAGTCLNGTALPWELDWEHNSAFEHFTLGECSNNLSVFGKFCNLTTKSQFRNSIYLASVRHCTFGSDVENNEIAMVDFVFNTVEDTVFDNTLISNYDSGSQHVFSVNYLGAQFKNNLFVLGGPCSYNVFMRFWENKFFVTGVGINQFFHVRESTFRGMLRNNTFFGDVRQCSFSSPSCCVAEGAVRYVKAEAGTDSTPFSGVRLYGPITGASNAMITLEHRAFLANDASRTTSRTINVEGNEDGEIIATWRGTHGVMQGIYATPAETRSGTWHNIQ